MYWGRRGHGSSLIIHIKRRRVKGRHRTEKYAIHQPPSYIIIDVLSDSYIAIRQKDLPTNTESSCNSYELYMASRKPHYFGTKNCDQPWRNLVWNQYLEYHVFIPTTNLYYSSTWTTLSFSFTQDTRTLSRTFERRLLQTYEIWAFEEFRWFLGIRVIRDKSTRTIKLIQDAFIDKIANKFGLEKKGIRFPDAPLTDNYLPPLTEDSDPDRTKQYQQLVGSLAYIATSTRPKIARAHSILARHLQNPGQKHLYAVQHVWRYLIHTECLAIGASASNRLEGDSPTLHYQVNSRSRITCSFASRFRDGVVGSVFQSHQIRPRIHPALWCDNEQTVSIANKPIETSNETQARRHTPSLAKMRSFWSQTTHITEANNTNASRRTYKDS